MRRRKASKRELLPDPKFKSILVTKFINNIMTRGKKSIAEKIFYDALKIIEDQTGQEGLTVFKKAIENVRPLLEVRSRRVGGSTYQVPKEVRKNRSIALAMRWIINFAIKRPEHTMKESIASELISASKNEGASIRKKDETHRMAEANKAFSHFRW